MGLGAGALGLAIAGVLIYYFMDSSSSSRKKKQQAEQSAAQRKWNALTKAGYGAAGLPHQQMESLLMMQKQSAPDQWLGGAQPQMVRFLDTLFAKQPLNMAAFKATQAEVPVQHNEDWKLFHMLSGDGAEHVGNRACETFDRHLAEARHYYLREGGREQMLQSIEDAPSRAKQAFEHSTPSFAEILSGTNTH